MLFARHMHVDTRTVYFLPISSRSEQVCLASSDLLHTLLALAGTRFLQAVRVKLQPVLCRCEP